MSRSAKPCLLQTKSSPQAPQSCRIGREYWGSCRAAHPLLERCDLPTSVRRALSETAVQLGRSGLQLSGALLEHLAHAHFQIRQTTDQVLALLGHWTAVRRDRRATADGSSSRNPSTCYRLKSTGSYLGHRILLDRSVVSCCLSSFTLWRGKAFARHHDRARR